MSTKFRDFFNRDTILDTIKSYHNDLVVTMTQKSETQISYTLVLSDQKDAGILNLYDNPDGTITLSPSLHKNHQLALSVAELVGEKCRLENSEKKTIYIRKFSKEHWDILIEFLSDCGLRIEDGSKLGAGIQKKVTGKYGDKIFLNYFNNHAFQIQGLGYTKVLAMECLAELLPYKELIDVQIKSIGVEVNADEIIEEFRCIMPDASVGLPEIFTTTMSPSITIRHLTVNLTDYAMFVMPIYKGLEGYLKLLFAERGCTLNNSDGFKTVVDLENNVPRLSEYGRKLTKSFKEASTIDNLLRYYNKHRNSLFHFNGIVETTRVISKKDDAIEIIEEVFQIIEQSYKEINS